MNTINYTSIEQSDTLFKHGLSLETADMYYPNRVDTKGEFAVPLELKHGNPLSSQEIPCWSVGALLEAIPGSFSLFNDGGYWWCEWCGTDSDFIGFNTGECNTAIEAVYKTVVWILENG